MGARRSTAGRGERVEAVLGRQGKLGREARWGVGGLVRCGSGRGPGRAAAGWGAGRRAASVATGRHQQAG